MLLYDHGGHHFTCELARDLQAEGTPMVYAFTDGVTAPHGRVQTSDALRVEALGKGRPFERYALAKRVVAEVRLGIEAANVTRRARVGHVITCNMPVIMVAILATWSKLTRRRFTVWFQDSQAGIAAKLVSSWVGLRLISWVEGWGLRRADRVIAISEAMVREAKRMGVRRDRIALLPNWAPISQIPVMDKANEWSVREGLDQKFVFLYSGTLGLKHSPERLVELARWIKQEGHDAVVLVVSEGPYAEQIEAEAQRDGLPLTRRPYQPAEVLPQVLATADVCVVLLDADGGEFSVPSKVWSYMCAGRAILASVPLENQAANEIKLANAGVSVASTAESRTFLRACEHLLGSREHRCRYGANGRAFAEEHFQTASVVQLFRGHAHVRGPNEEGKQ